MGRLPFDPKKMAGPAEPQVDRDAPLTVGRLAALIDAALRDRLPKTIRVVGELTGLATRTHWYFRLADDTAPEGAQAVLDCVMFASAARRVGFEPRNGQRVLLTGRVEFYPRQGRTQFYAERMESVGAGDLDQRLKALLAEIKTLGWLDPERKRPLPDFPRRVAVVTSRAGAALQDVLVTMRRRCPAVDVAIVDVRVQGDGAADQIAHAIAWLSRNHAELSIDAVIVTRGGGSAEDLWAFNERAVAEAIVKSAVPVVAAIGHETDVTVAELVADERCATPTQAAMRLTPDRESLTEQLDQISARLITAIGRCVDRNSQRLRSIARNRVLADPTTLILLPTERLSERSRRLVAAARRGLADARLRVETLLGRLGVVRPQSQAALAGARLDEFTRRLSRAMRERLRAVDMDSLEDSLGAAWGAGAQARETRLATLERELIVTSPMHVLRRGYSVTTGPDGRPIRSPREIIPGQTVTTRVADGAFRSRITDTVDVAPHDAASNASPLPPPRAPQIAPKPRRRSGPARPGGRDQLGLFGSGDAAE